MQEDLNQEEEDLEEKPLTEEEIDNARSIRESDDYDLRTHPFI